MEEATEKKRRDGRFLLGIAIPSAVMILTAALEALMAGKDRELFAAWLAANPGRDAGDYLNMHILLFLFSILLPFSLTLYTAVTIERFGIPSNYRLVWGFLTVAALVNKFLEMRWRQPGFYLTLALYFLLLTRILRIRTSEEVKRPI